MGSRQKKKHPVEKKGDEPAVDRLAQKVDEVIKAAGASSMGIGYAEAHSPTMAALLSRYTQSGTLAEIDDEGEHLLFPTSRTERTGEPWGLGLTDAVAGSDAERRGATSQEPGGFSDVLLRHLDNECLPEIKDHFLRSGNALNAEDFVALLSGHLGHVEGIDERQMAAELATLHERLTMGPQGSQAGSQAEAPDDRGAAESTTPFITESIDAPEGTAAPGSETTHKLMSWSMFAQFLLDEGVVGDVVRSFNVVKVLSHIEKNNITPLHHEFLNLGNALTLEQFVVLMKAEFQHIFELTRVLDLHHEERHLVAQLVSLYEMIDIDGSNALAWEEFTAFLVDQGMTDDAPREFNVIRFSPSVVRDDKLLQSHCVKAVYLKHYDKIAFVEHKARSLKLCTPDLVPCEEITDLTQKPLCAEYIEKWAFIVVACSDLTLSFFDTSNKLKLVRRILTKTAQLVLCWSEVAQSLFSADQDGRIFAWDVALVKAGSGRSDEKGEGGDPWKEFLKPEIAQQVPPMRHIEAVDSSGEASSSSQAKAPQQRGNRGGGTSALERSKANDSVENHNGGEASSSSQAKAPQQRTNRGGGTSGHERGKATDPGDNFVTMLLELPELSRLASCGIDHNVMIWDVFTGKLMRTLKGHHMGVRCMAFAMSAKVLVTGGYDYALLVWNPYVGKRTHAIQGHAAPIVGIDVVGATSNQLVSVDADGFMKTWDLSSSSYQCLQTIAVDEILTLRAFISVPLHKRVFVVDRKFIAYDYQNTGVLDQTDEEPIIKAVYHPRLRIFITGCATHLRIWDACTGAITCVIQHKEAEVTDFCLDDRGRKVFVADHAGRIFVHSTSTGCLIKELTAHEKEVSGMIYCPGDRNLVTVSWDRSIVVHDESDKKLSKVWRKATNIHNDDISCVAFSRHLGLLATGSTDCVIAVREYERLRTLSHLLGHKTGINALAFVEPFALLASADVSGRVAIWAVPTPSGRDDHKYVNQVLTRFINMQSLESSAAVNCLAPVCEASNHFVLYTGDEDGDIRAWDVSHLLVAADVKVAERKTDWDPHKRAPPFDAAHTTAPMAKMAESLETPELAICVDEQVVRQVLSWRAHSDSIRSLAVYAEPACIVTAGYDHMAKVWTHEGHLVCALRAGGVTAWRFPVKTDEITVDAATIDALLEVVHRTRPRSMKLAAHRMTDAGFDIQNEVDVERHKERLRHLDMKGQTNIYSKAVHKTKLV